MIEIRNFLQFSRNFSDLPILRVCWCGPGPPFRVAAFSALRTPVAYGIANFSQFSAVFLHFSATGFDPSRPPPPTCPVALEGHRPSPCLVLDHGQGKGGASQGGNVREGSLQMLRGDGVLAHS